MQPGDVVFVYVRHDSLDHFFIQANAIFNNKYGTFYHNDMIGKPFGSKINSKSSPGYIYLLEPTPELWSTALHVRSSRQLL
jgi:tRNA (adenine57-N1/adenine58-N1)-methyltransferase